MICMLKSSAQQAPSSRFKILKVAKYTVFKILSNNFIGSSYKLKKLIKVWQKIWPTRPEMAGKKLAIYTLTFFFLWFFLLYIIVAVKLQIPQYFFYCYNYSYLHRNGYRCVKGSHLWALWFFKVHVLCQPVANWYNDVYFYNLNFFCLPV